MSEKCKRCGGVKLTQVSGKTADACCTKNLDTGEETDGYTNANPRLDKIQLYGDYLEFTFCLDCGTIQELCSSTRQGSAKPSRSPIGFETSGDA